MVGALEPADPRYAGKYRLVRKLGSGGMGRVFLGQSPGGHLVAVKPAGTASDIFSLGSVLAFAATGHEPLGSGTAPALLYRVVHTPPDIGEVPSSLQALVERCLAKDPAQRPTADQIGIWRVYYRGYNAANWEFTDHKSPLLHVLDCGFIVAPGRLAYAGPWSFSDTETVLAAERRCW